jgi:sulfopyruvate decarboxylase TPP-binding subunit
MAEPNQLQWPDGSEVAAALAESGVTHVVWIPDSALGRWDRGLSANPDIQLVRACREGEALAIAAGLLIGGRSPVVMLQCTGLFEAGDALRNVVHDLGLPLFLAVGIRNFYGHRAGTSSDTAPRFAPGIVRAWEIAHATLEGRWRAADLARLYTEARSRGEPAMALLAE